jgi:hypothetical protein
MDTLDFKPLTIYEYELLMTNKRAKMKSVTFSNIVRVILIPTIKEFYFMKDLLWYTTFDYQEFRNNYSTKEYEENEISAEEI